MFTFLKNVFKKGELRQKVIFTLGILFVCRLGAAITIPSVNTGALSSSDATNGIFGIMNLLGGGTLERFSLFSLGVSPYITSSIIIELLSMDVIPALSQWRKEGNTGKKKKDRVTRYVTLFLAALQGGVLTYAFDNGYKILADSSIWTYIYVVLIMMAGSMLAVWLGDQITNKGIGNGVSLLIFTGIVSNLPSSFISTFNNLVDTSGKAGDMWLGIAWYALFVVVYLSIVIFVVFNEGAVRKIPIIYATSSNTTMRTKDQTHMPIKINSSGVIPVIFASSFIATPNAVLQALSGRFGSENWYKVMMEIFNYNTAPGATIYTILIVAFTFFYAFVQVNPEKLAENLQKQGSYIPSVRPGKGTEEYVSRLLMRLSTVGAVFLGLVALLPIIAQMVWDLPQSIGLGGTSLLIVIGVALETAKQLEGLMLKRKYVGFIE